MRCRRTVQFHSCACGCPIFPVSLTMAFLTMGHRHGAERAPTGRRDSMSINHGHNRRTVVPGANRTAQSREDTQQVLMLYLLHKCAPDPVDQPPPWTPQSLTPPCTAGHYHTRQHLQPPVFDTGGAPSPPQRHHTAFRPIVLIPSSHLSKLPHTDHV